MRSTAASWLTAPSSQPVLDYRGVNAACESCISTLKREWIKRHRYQSRDQARLSIFRYIETFYNPRRRHSSLGGISPDEYEIRSQDRRQIQDIDTMKTTRAA